MKSYTYSDLIKDLKRLSVPYYSIGRTTFERNIYGFTLGKGEKQILIVGAHHGLEWLTPPLIMEFARQYLEHLKSGKRLMGYNILKLYETATIHLIPMLNPDGIEIATFGTDSPYLNRINLRNDFKKNWQSNGRGVDLNHNYDAGFNLLKEQEYKMGIFGPCATRYGGTHPESEPETKALCDYVRKNDFKLCIAYHSQGEVIYYDYNGYVPENSYEILKALCKESTYRPDKTEEIASYGGFKDWFIEKYRLPAYTVEVGLGKNPLSYTQFPDIVEKNIPLILLASFLG